MKRVAAAVLLVFFVFSVNGQFGTKIGQVDMDAVAKKKKSLPISVAFSGTPVRTVMKVLSEKIKMNIIVSRGVKARISITLRNLSPERILALILKTHDLSIVRDGDVYVVVKSNTKYGNKLRSDKIASRVIRIRNCPAEAVFVRMRRIYLKGRPKQATKSSFYIGEERVILDLNLNSIILHGRRKQLSRLAAVVRKLDLKVSDVLIKVKIVEISLENNFKFGINWSTVGDVSVSQIMSPTIGSTDNQISLNFTKIFTGGPLKKLGLTGILRAISQDNDVKIISSPSIVCANRNSARIHIGSSVPYTKVTTTKDGDKLTDYNYQKVGIKLNVLPKIFKSYVTLKIRPEISSAKDVSEPGQAPIVDTTMAETIVTLKNGETVIIGGLIQTRKSKIINRVPLLGHIPILGKLFSSTEKVDSKKELVIFITPIVIGHDNSVLKPKKKTKKS